MSYLCLILEREPSVADSMRRAFASQGLRSYLVDSFELAQDLLRHWNFDGIVIDRSLIGAHCHGLMAQLKLTSITPLVLLCEHVNDESQLAGLTAGASDVPRNSSSELIAMKLKRMIEMRTNSRAEKVKDIRLGSLMLSHVTGGAYIDHKPLDLTAYQFDLLSLLALRAGDPISRESLVQLATGFSGSAVRNIDVQVHRIRKKLRALGCSNVGLKTVRGRGYCLDIEPAAEAS